MLGFLFSSETTGNKECVVPALRGSLLTTADLCGMQGGTLCSLGAELEPHVFYSDLSAADSPAFV